MPPSQHAETSKDGIKTEPGLSKTVFKLNGVWIAYTHTFFACSAFICALVTACILHYDKITSNRYFAYPDEWFPSVSSAIGDYYPERGIFQVLIALTSSSRFALCFMVYFLTAVPHSILPNILLVIGILRTFACGGWAFITTGDDFIVHTVFMVLYIGLTIPYYVLRISLTPKTKARVRKFRLIAAGLFTLVLLPLVCMFVQHSIYRVPGAYTFYSIMEWQLVVLDVFFDSLESCEFRGLEIAVNDEFGETRQSSETEFFSKPEKIVESKSTVFGFFVSVVNWFVWWSVITSVGAMIWYFPLWFMEMSGYEAYTLTVLSPILLVLPPIRSLFTSLPQLAFVGQVLAVSAYSTFYPTQKMAYVGLGAAFASVAAANTFYKAARSADPQILMVQSAAFITGLLCTVVLRIYGYTNNPIWPIMNSTNGGLNCWGVAIGLFGAVYANCMIPKTKNDHISEPSSKPSSEPSSEPSSWSSIVASSCGLGAAVFFAFTYMTDVSNLPLFLWEGYPISGPLPIPHGILVVFVISLGLKHGVSNSSVLRTRNIALFSAMMVLLTLTTNWTGFLVGLVAVFYLTAFLPSLLAAAAVHTKSACSAVVFALASLVTVGLYFMETWTVAYAFVPGGWLLRERIWVVMVTETILIAAGVLNARNVDIKYSFSASMHKLVNAFLVFLAVFASLGTYRRWNRALPTPLHPESTSFNAGIWTVHFGLDNMLWASEQRMADLFRDAELDVVGLLETDTQHTVGGHRDITQEIAEKFGYYVDYGPSPCKHTWGCALLSRFPIVSSTHHLTPSPHGELAPAIHATLQVYGELVDVVVFHAGQQEDVLDRQLQTEYVSQILHSTADRPTILLSYLVTRPLIGNYLKWVSEFTGMQDIDSKDRHRWCEYILYKNIKRVAYARISRGTITDTELQIGKFQVGVEPNYSNERVVEKQVHPSLRMPELFKDTGVRGHRYHVFDEPLYYM